MIHTFDTNIAAECGVTPAVLLNNIYFWIKLNESNEKHFYEGQYWIYTSVASMVNFHPYLTANQIRTAIEHLKKHDLIKTGRFDNKINNVVWYGLTEKSTLLFESVGLLENTNHFVKKPKRFVKKPKPILSYKDNNKIYNKNNKKNLSKPSEEFCQEFENIWKQYPRKIGKGKITEKTLKKLEKVGLENLQVALTKYKAYLIEKQVEEKFIMHGSTFFNSGYVDYLPEEKPEPKVLTVEETEEERIAKSKRESLRL